MKTREELLKNGYSLDADSMIYSERLVKAILAAPTEEQQSCEMCHATLSGRAYTITDYQHQIKNFVSGLNHDAIKNIKYCQWCGRKLGDD